MSLSQLNLVARNRVVHAILLSLVCNAILFIGLFFVQGAKRQVVVAVTHAHGRVTPVSVHRPRDSMCAGQHRRDQSNASQAHTAQASSKHAVHEQAHHTSQQANQSHQLQKSSQAQQNQQQSRVTNARKQSTGSVGTHTASDHKQRRSHSDRRHTSQQQQKRTSKQPQSETHKVTHSTQSSQRASSRQSQRNASHNQYASHSQKRDARHVKNDTQSQYRHNAHSQAKKQHTSMSKDMSYQQSENYGSHDKRTQSHHATHTHSAQHSAAGPVHLDSDDISEYVYRYMISEITRSWHPPAGIDTDASCHVKVSLTPHGKVDAVSLEQSSGILAFDIAARAAMWRIQYPESLWGNEVIIVFG